MISLKKLRENTKRSAFNRQGYRVTCEVGHIHRNLRFYSEDYTEKVADLDLVAAMTPEFQRDNDKWDLSRKIKFVENIMSGYPTDIILFTVNNDIMSDCGILDGQQRLTAINDWFSGKFPIYGDIFYSELQHLRRAPFTDCRLSFVIHNFSTIQDAVNFYIDINEGITHSSEDIVRARKYLEST